MIEITQGATALLNGVRAAEGIPPTYGLRFYSEQDGTGADAVGIAFAKAPAEGDQVEHQRELPVYVAPEVAQELASAVLDVEGTDGSSQRFVIRAP